MWDWFKKLNLDLRGCCLWMWREPSVDLSVYIEDFPPHCTVSMSWRWGVHGDEEYLGFHSYVAHPDSCFSSSVISYIFLTHYFLADLHINLQAIWSYDPCVQMKWQKKRIFNFEMCRQASNSYPFNISVVCFFFEWQKLLLMDVSMNYNVYVYIKYLWDSSMFAQIQHCKTESKP